MLPFDSFKFELPVFSAQKDATAPSSLKIKFRKFTARISIWCFQDAKIIWISSKLGPQITNWLLINGLRINGMVIWSYDQLQETIDQFNWSPGWVALWMNIWMKFSDSGSKSKQSDYDIILLGLVISANQCLLGKQTLSSSIICSTSFYNYPGSS